LVGWLVGWLVGCRKTPLPLTFEQFSRWAFQHIKMCNY